MPIDLEAAMQLRDRDAHARYTPTEAILYALGLGFGRDPLDAAELRFVYEKNLLVIPTLATSLAFVANHMTAKIGFDLTLLVHGEQAMIFHRPMPAAAETLVDTRIVDMFDKGPGKGAVVIVENNVRIKGSDEMLVTLTASLFARGDGVSGDFNPLHVDPAVAAKAGFQRPILHGLCTYGICCRAILRHVLNYDPTPIVAFSARFSNPVIPGETLVTEIWRDAADVSFRSRVKE